MMGAVPLKMPDAVSYNGYSFGVDAEGYVHLEKFSERIFDLHADDLGSFFDEQSRFYDKYQWIREGLRHNLIFRTVMVDILSHSEFDKASFERRACTGGIYHEDFLAFVERAKKAIAENNRLFDEIPQGVSESERLPVRERLSFLGYLLSAVAAFFSSGFLLLILAATFLLGFVTCYKFQKIITQIYLRDMIKGLALGAALSLPQRFEGSGWMYVVMMGGAFIAVLVFSMVLLEKIERRFALYPMKSSK